MSKKRRSPGKSTLLTFKDDFKVESITRRPILHASVEKMRFKYASDQDITYSTHPVTFLSDSKDAIQLINCKADLSQYDATSRRWLAITHEESPKLEFKDIPGHKNIIADALSRIDQTIESEDNTYASTQKPQLM